MENEAKPLQTALCVQLRTLKLLTQNMPHEKLRSALNCGRVGGRGTDHWRHPSITFFSSAPHFSTVRLYQRHNKTLCAVDKDYVSIEIHHAVGGFQELESH
jgi:hypothetical protein